MVKFRKGLISHSPQNKCIIMLMMLGFYRRCALGSSTFSLIQASSLSTFLLNSCRLLAPLRALFWLAAVCFRVCHWSLRWLSCLRTRSEVGFALQISCSPIFKWGKKRRWARWRWDRKDNCETVKERIWHLKSLTVIAYMFQSGFEMLDACHLFCGF